MLQIILCILKIIGIIVACLLGLILLLLFVVFIVPIRYEGQATYKEVINGKITIHWLLHLLTIKVNIENNKISYYLRFFGKKWVDSTKKAEKPLKNQEEVKENILEETRDDEKEVSDDFQNEDFDLEEENHIEENDGNNNYVDIEEAISLKKQSKKHFFANIKEKYNAIREKITIFCKKVKAIPKRIKEIVKVILNRKKRIVSIIKDEDNKKTFALLWNQLIRILKHMKPKIFRLRLHFGFDNPASTGQVLGVIATFMPVYEDNILVNPDFEKEVFEGELVVKGRIQLFVLLLAFIKVMRDKNFHKLKKQIFK